ncbi:MAG: IS3 family transposase [Phototrophicaceae bacterium]
MKYEAIKQWQDEFPVAQMCKVLAVSESGYYAWLKREPSAGAIENAQLSQQIATIWRKFHRIYGAPRIWAELLELGVKVSLNRVAELMREAGLQGKTARKNRPQTTQSEPSHAVAPNLLNRTFKGHQRHQVWLTDITYIQTDEGYLYLAGVMDLGSREIVGMAMADHMRTELTLDALNMAIIQHQPPAGLMHHSDRGSQYTSHAYQQRVSDANMLASMSRTGNCLDNAPMESFWATLKRECADYIFANHQQARAEIFSYIMGFYNRTRRHSALGYSAPVQLAA